MEPIEIIDIRPGKEFLPIGTICNLKDPIDPLNTTMCTVRLVEEDEEIPNIYYYYLRANNEEKNIHYDPRIGSYFDIIHSTSDRLVVMSM